MKADFTRQTFNPGKNYSRVLMQQGRVQLDADWNEQAAIELGFIRQLGADLIGPAGGPVTAFLTALDSVTGFSPIAFGPNDTPPSAADFLLAPGHYYVDGVLCANAASSVIVTGYPAAQANANQTLTVFSWTTDGMSFQAGEYAWLYNATPGTPLNPVLVQIASPDYAKRTFAITGDKTAIQAFVADANSGFPANHFLCRAPTYLTQADYPVPPPLADGSYCQVYLDVWERAITCAEDDSIREVALGGPDTAARAKVVAQVKTIVSTPQDDTCRTPAGLTAMFQSPMRGCLAARAKPVQVSSDPCTISPDALYRGPENQLYRVEIHTGTDSSGDSSGVTFKWSRENGAVVFPIAGVADPTFTLETLGRDDRFSLTEGDWVEVVDDGYALIDTPAPLRQVLSIDRVRMTVVLSGKANGTTGTDPTQHPFLRRWDEKAGDPGQQGLTLSTTDNAALVFPPVVLQVNAVRNQGANFNKDILQIAQTASPWFELEDGVQVQFTVPPQSQTPVTQFRSGDYWLIPARVATGNVDWPVETVPGNAPAPLALLPDGPVHHYAPIGRISVSGKTVNVIDDCTTLFGPVEPLAVAHKATPKPKPPPAPKKGT
jgi:uncharacterized protein DUF6519